MDIGCSQVHLTQPCYYVIEGGYFDAHQHSAVFVIVGYCMSRDCVVCSLTANLNLEVYRNSCEGYLEGILIGIINTGHTYI